MIESTLFGRILGLANLGMMVLDSGQRVIYWNQWLASRSGMSASRVQGLPLLELFPELSGQRVEQAVLTALSSNLPSILPPAQNAAPFPLYAAGIWGGDRIDQAVT